MATAGGKTTNQLSRPFRYLLPNYTTGFGRLRGLGMLVIRFSGILSVSSSDSAGIGEILQSVSESSNFCRPLHRNRKLHTDMTALYHARMFIQHGIN